MHLLQPILNAKGRRLLFGLFERFPAVPGGILGSAWQELDNFAGLLVCGLCMHLNEQHVLVWRPLASLDVWIELICGCPCQNARTCKQQAYSTACNQGAQQTPLPDCPPPESTGACKQQASEVHNPKFDSCLISSRRDQGQKEARLGNNEAARKTSEKYTRYTVVS